MKPDSGSPTSATRRLALEDALLLAERACLGAGASPAAARSLARATISAQTWGRESVGFEHLPDYLEGLRDGSIAGWAEPKATFPSPALISVDAGGGIGQLAFDVAAPELEGRTRALGAAVLMLRGSFTVGELGYYVRRLAQVGLVGLAATNSQPLLAPPGACRPLYGTNPLALAAPSASGDLLVIDQSSSSTALVNVRRAAAKGERLPEGWALDGAGDPTTDPQAALAGSLTPFGGFRGGNLALLVEVLAAGLTGAAWSLDASGRFGGEGRWNAGLFLFAIDPGDRDGFAGRLALQLARLEEHGVRVPGHGRRAAQERAGQGGLELPVDLLERIESYIGPRSDPDG